MSVAGGMIRGMRAVQLDYDDESGDGLDTAVAARARVNAAEADQFDAIVSYVTADADADRDAHGEHGREVYDRHAGQRIQFGGSGTPAVPEFVAAEIGPALGLSAEAGRRLIADACDLTYRLPLLYACLHAGTVDAWRVRKVAAATRKFTLAQAGEADRRLAADTLGDGTPMLARVGPARLSRILDQIRITDDPDDAENDRDNARERRHVNIWPLGDGVAGISGTLSADDAARLDQRLDQIVDWLRFLGDERPKDVLRSVAMGYLTEPDSYTMLYDQVIRARAAASDTRDIHDGSADTDDASDAPAEEPGDRTDGQAGPTKPSEQAERPAAFTRAQVPATVIHLHYDRTWGTWSMDGFGAITKSDAAEIVGHSHVTIRPVIDLAETISATGYVASPRLKEQTALRNGGVCTFPSCTRPARACDFDHLINYADDGPTDSNNGHRLCRYHHRAKTFDDWTVNSPAPGVWLWTSPTGRTYLVTGGTTTRLPGRDPARSPRRRKRDAA